VGKWEECNRFNHCEIRDYEKVFPEEKLRPAFRSEVPVSLQKGKYRFDFASCRSTWVTQAIGPDPIELNIGGGRKYNCEISIFPRSVMEHGGGGDYTCWVPYAVGVRTFDTLDLMKEFPRIGLPQFCRPEQNYPEPFMIRSGIEEFAFSLDLVCATSGRTADGRGVLRIKLNRFASNLVREASRAKEPLNTILCSKEIEGPQVATDSAGKTNVSYQPSTDAAEARRQLKCFREKVKVPMPCSR
jgi:hypothetical protein